MTWAPAALVKFQEAVKDKGKGKKMSSGASGSEKGKGKDRERMDIIDSERYVPTMSGSGSSPVAAPINGEMETEMIIEEEDTESPNSDNASDGGSYDSSDTDSLTDVSEDDVDQEHGVHMAVDEDGQMWFVPNIGELVTYIIMYDTRDALVEY